MFSESTKGAMLALAAVDTGVTNAEREDLVRLLSGRVAVQSRRCGVVRYAEAARRLGMSVQSVKRMVANGMLRRVSTGGPRAYGVTEESLVGLASAGDGDGSGRKGLGWVAHSCAQGC